MYNLALFHVPQAKQKIFLYKFAECERVWTALSNFSLAPNDRYSHFIVECDGPEVSDGRYQRFWFRYDTSPIPGILVDTKIDTDTQFFPFIKITFKTRTLMFKTSQRIL